MTGTGRDHRVAVAALLALVALLAGCRTTTEVGSTDEEVLAAVEAVAPDVAALDGVAGAEVRTDGSTGIDDLDAIVVRVELADEVTDEEAAVEVLDRAIEVVWTSDIPEVSSIAATASGSGVEYVSTGELFDGVPFADQLEARYGPRPQA